MIPNLGIDVPFVIDAYAKDYVAASSEQLKITSSTDTLPKSIVLGDRGGTVVAQLRDKQANPVAGIEVMMLADPSGLPSNSRGSWTHVKSFHQVGNSSSLGNVRFSGVPVGKILVRAKFDQGVAEQRATVVSGQELSLQLTEP